MEHNQDLTVAHVTVKVNGGVNVLRNIFHFNSEATENTLRKMPKFNPYQTGHGVIGDTKYNRRKTKRELRKLIDEL